MYLLWAYQKGFKIVRPYLQVLCMWKCDRQGLSGSLKSETIWRKCVTICYLAPKKQRQMCTDTLVGNSRLWSITSNVSSDRSSITKADT